VLLEPGFYCNAIEITLSLSKRKKEISAWLCLFFSVWYARIDAIKRHQTPNDIDIFSVFCYPKFWVDMLMPNN